jgi:purine-binding chemotaxis protein CheW
MGTNGHHEKTKRDLDWDVIRRQVAAIGDRLAMVEEENPEDLAVIWQRRAVQLARLPEQDDKDEQVELLLVRIGREIFGLEVGFVHDIRVLEGITRVPRTPPWIAGVVNVHGQILTALRLEQFFGLASSNGKERENGNGTQYMVLVQAPQGEMVLIVKEVLAVETIKLGQVQNNTGTIRGIRPEFVRGVVPNATQNDEMLVFLDLPIILSDPKLIVREEAL